MHITRCDEDHFPEFDIMMETPQNNPHHKYNVGIHTIEAMKQIEAEHIYRWTMLLHDVGKPTARVEGPDKDHFKNASGDRRRDGKEDPPKIKV